MLREQLMRVYDYFFRKKRLVANPDSKMQQYVKQSVEG
jgi:hypothetical protein